MSQLKFLPAETLIQVLINLKFVSSVFLSSHPVERDELRLVGICVIFFYQENEVNFGK